MRYYLRNILNYINEFGLGAALSLILQRAVRSEYISFQPKGVSRRLVLRRNSSDFAVLRQVIGQREVEFNLPSPPEKIVDVGANIGLASVLFANKWPSAQIIAIEPDKDNFELLRKNTCGYQNISCIHGAVWSHRCQMTIKNPDVESFSFQVEEARDGNSANSVTGMTVRDLITLLDGQIDLLKIDIEGAEFELFDPKYLDWLGNVQHIAVELHERYAPGVTERVQSACIGYRESRHGEYHLFSLVDTEQC